MRVIAGSARRLSLKTVEGLDTRPTTDRIKETLFNMINDKVCESNFLDLYSGSGAIGIEALSRGASSCYFVENNISAVKCIEENLKNTRLEKNAIVIRHDVNSSLSKLSDTGSVFSIVFMDPPYQKQLEEETLKNLVKYKLINQETLIIVEADKMTDFGFISSIGLKIIKEKIYKTNKHVFIGLE